MDYEIARIVDYLKLRGFNYVRMPLIRLTRAATPAAVATPVPAPAPISAPISAPIPAPVPDPVPISATAPQAAEPAPAPELTPVPRRGAPRPRFRLIADVAETRIQEAPSEEIPGEAAAETWPAAPPRRGGAGISRLLLRDVEELASPEPGAAQDAAPPSRRTPAYKLFS